MHSDPGFLTRVATPLGFYYMLLCVLNWGAALVMWRKGAKTYTTLGLGALKIPVTNVLIWLLVGSAFFICAPLAMIGLPPELPSEVKQVVNELSGPVTLTLGSLALFTALFVFRRAWTAPPVAWTLFNLALLAMGMSMTDPNFTAIVAKPDNVPIVGLVFLLGFFTWLATYKAVLNDDRAAQGLRRSKKKTARKSWSGPTWSTPN